MVLTSRQACTESSHKASHDFAVNKTEIYFVGFIIFFDRNFFEEKTIFEEMTV